MSKGVRFGRNDARSQSQGWELLNPSHPLFPILFPKTMEEAVRGAWSQAATANRALTELRSKIRHFLFSGLATSEVVDHIVEEVIVRMGVEQPLRRIDPRRGNGGGLFHAFLRRRVAKEARRLQRSVVTVSLSDAVISAEEKDFDGSSAENRELLHLAMAWLADIPKKQADAIRKWLVDETRQPGAPSTLTSKDRVNLTRGKIALRSIARMKGLRN
jgi:DNA-directed RNA polymerase specialized sigma24 family protein